MFVWVQYIHQDIHLGSFLIREIINSDEVSSRCLLSGQIVSRLTDESIANQASSILEKDGNFDCFFW